MDGLGSRIKAAADEVGGLDRLAEMIPTMSRRSLSDYVNDRTDPRASVVKEISEATGVSAGWILAGQGEPLMPLTPPTHVEHQQLDEGERERRQVAESLKVPIELAANHRERIMRENRR